MFQRNRQNKAEALNPSVRFKASIIIILPIVGRFDRLVFQFQASVNYQNQKVFSIIRDRHSIQHQKINTQKIKLKKNHLRIRNEIW